MKKYASFNESLVKSSLHYENQVSQYSRKFKEWNYVFYEKQKAGSVEMSICKN